ncbi:MAG: flagellar hook basal-body protein [Parvularculaceae bacterium]
MSFSGLMSIGLSGLNAFAKGLEAVSSNIANSQSSGYKRVRTDFSDLIPVGAPSLNQTVGAGVIGTGVSAAARQLVDEQGAILRTNEHTNIAIAGDGFFVVSKDVTPANDFLFTRAGDFSPDALGNLVNASGLYLQGATIDASGAASVGSLAGLETVNINRTPAGASAATLGALTGVTVDEDGLVIASYANGETRPLFQIPLALFTNTSGLEEGDATTFMATTLSGVASLAAARSGRAGAIEGAAVEASTVDIGQEFSTLIQTQRAYSTNARVLSVADELWRTAVETAA